MKFCGICGAGNPDSVKYCSQCGRSLDLEPKPGMCVECGSLNAIGIAKCGNCGADIPIPMPPKSEETKSISKCKWCRNIVREGEDVCQQCRSRSADTKPKDLSSKKRMKGKPSRRLVLGAIFMMLSGLATLGVGLMLLIIESLVVELSGYGTGVGTYGAIMILLGLGALAGGILAMWRRQFTLVLVGSFCSFLCFVTLTGAMLGFTGMIVIGVPLGCIGPWFVSGANEEFD